jgi:hypothetical protein
MSGSRVVALPEMKVLVSRPSRFTPAERAHGTQWVGDCMGPREGLDAVEQAMESKLSLSYSQGLSNSFVTFIFFIRFVVTVYDDNPV